MKVDWDELKRLDVLRNEDMRGVGLNRANEIMEAKLAFLKLLEASFPAILAEREAAQRFINQVKYELHRANPDDLAVNLLNHLRELPQ